MKCPKCQSTKLVTGNAGLITLIPFLYCPVCKVEAVEDVPPPPSITEEDGPFKDLVSLPWYMGVVYHLDMQALRPYYQVKLLDGNLVSGSVNDIPLTLPIFKVGDLVEIQHQLYPRITGIRPYRPCPEGNS